MAVTQACCCIPPVESNYKPVGTMETIANMSNYVVGPKDAKKLVVVIYDIFGMHNNTMQFCDRLAQQCGFRVVMPDLLHGDYWSHERMGDMDTLVAWITRVGALEVVAPELAEVKKHLESEGFSSAGILGFCWGAKIGVAMAAEDSFYSAATMVHPSFVDVKDAEKANAPILALPSKDEPDMTEYMNVLRQKPFGDKCEHHRFDDMPHGFCAARGDYTDELNVKRATEAIQLTANFFNKYVGAKN
ncbi:dienelactone hydrolase [Radiomyces spectabilis]|uniref:dienelactone hydrolase n=1 Tax=Radiomyces spectabilis TaxID=64574 RepID=UPI00221E9BB7|nr:dienelactone hydrolase [Radiomyces spectabilis]KAI8393453.1 dienelactone hydrolase [Radiomyces spectabilis]